MSVPRDVKIGPFAVAITCCVVGITACLLMIRGTNQQLETLREEIEDLRRAATTLSEESDPSCSNEAVASALDRRLQQIELELEWMRRTPATPSHSNPHAEDAEGGQAHRGEARSLESLQQFSGQLPSLADLGSSQIEDRLELDDEQAEETYRLMQDAAHELQEICEAYLDGETNLSTFRRDFWTIKDGLDEAMRDVLDEDQDAQYEQLQSEAWSQFNDWLPDLAGGGTRGDTLNVQQPVLVKVE